METSRQKSNTFWHNFRSVHRFDDPRAKTPEMEFLREVSLEDVQKSVNELEEKLRNALADSLFESSYRNPRFFKFSGLFNITLGKPRPTPSDQRPVGSGFNLGQVMDLFNMIGQVKRQVFSMIFQVTANPHQQTTPTTQRIFPTTWWTTPTTWWTTPTTEWTTPESGFTSPTTPLTTSTLL